MDSNGIRDTIHGRMQSEDNFPLSFEPLIFADHSNKMHDVFCCGILHCIREKKNLSRRQTT